MKPSFSYFIIYLGVKGKLGLSCSNNEVFPRYDVEEEYRSLEEGKISSSPSYYLLVPSLVGLGGHRGRRLAPCGGRHHFAAQEVIDDD